MPFKNSLLAGTALVRAAINSPNFVSGVSGWSINKDGSAEFHDISIRGTFRTGDPPDPYVEIMDTGSSAQVILSSGDPGETNPGRIYAFDDTVGSSGVGTSLIIYAPNIGQGAPLIKMHPKSTALGSTPSIEFANAQEGADEGIEALIYGDLEIRKASSAKGNLDVAGYILVDGHIDVPVLYATFAIMGDPNAANVAINGNQVYARNAAVNNGHLYLNHASSGNVYLGQTGIITVEPGGVLNSSTTYLHLNWTNSKPCAIGSSATVQSRLGGAGGWRVDDTLQVVGHSTFAYPVAGTANTSLTVGGLLQRISSSRRYKTDIEELTVDPQKILQLVPRQFRFKHHFETIEDEWTNSGGNIVVELPPEEAPLHTGFIAEEAEELGLEEWVEYDSEGRPEGFHYVNFVAAHQIVLRSQAKQIAALEKQLADLSKTVTELRGRLKL